MNETVTAEFIRVFEEIVSSCEANTVPDLASVVDARRILEKLPGDGHVAASSRTASFNTLAYGAKFRNSPTSSRVWVKIGHDLVAAWDASKISDTWVGQAICAFSEDGDLSTLVYLEPYQ